MRSEKRDGWVREFESLLPVIRDVVRWTSRRRRFSFDEAEEFSSYVMLKLVEGDFRRIRKFEGRSSVRTYLTTVIQRLALDFVIQKGRKWRPSARAVASGSIAVRLEELVYRHHFSFDEAQETLRQNHGVDMDRDELWSVLLALPVREPPVQVPILEAERLASPGLPPEPGTRQPRRRVASALQRALGELSPENRLLVRLRFVDQLSFRRIAAILQIEPRTIYPRAASVLRGLRASLESQGIDLDSTSEILEARSLELDWEALAADVPRVPRRSKSSARPDLTSTHQDSMGSVSA